MYRTVFITNSSACLNLRAPDLRAPPRWGDFSWTNFLPSGSLPAVRGVATGLICLLLCSQIECVHRGCVNRQKCGGAGTWRAGPPKETSSKGCQTELPVYHCCYVWCYVTWPRMEPQMFVCYLQAAYMRVLLGDNSRTLQMFIASLLVDVSSQSQFPAACLATDFTPAQDGHELLLLARHSPPFTLPFWS